MFWKKPKSAVCEEVFFPAYAIKKIGPKIGNNFSTAFFAETKKRFERGLGSTHTENQLLSYGRDTAIFASLSLAKSIAETSASGLTDAEFGDCYLCAVFCLTQTFREVPNLMMNSLTFWGAEFRKDTDYLLLTEEFEIEDICENGWNQYLRYCQSDNAVLPKAYLNLLSRAISQRRQGDPTPYKRMDPFMPLEAAMLANLEMTYDEQTSQILNNWVKVAAEIQSIAALHEMDFWEDW
jgi:hypothetical protein